MKTIVVFLLSILLFCCYNRQIFLIDIEIVGKGKVEGLPQNRMAKEGEVITLLALPEEGFIFTGWQIDTFTNDNPLSLYIKNDIKIKVIFVPKPSDEMIFISAKNNQFMMGSSDKSAYPFEKPLHPVKFTYDFFISKYEITKAMYKNIMNGNINVQYTESDDSLPITNISWYDAVLFCNNLSKLKGYDTVYTYSAKCEISGSCPYILENLKIHYERFGYRLPTEAEWEYACRAGSKDEYFWGNDYDKAHKYAWYFDNSNNSIHPVGQKEPNDWGLYDMCGNAAEFVNDWLAPYTDSLYVNPIGPTHLTLEEFEESYERPIRGGSYRQSISFLRSGCRRGPYETQYAVTLVDLGFRIAMGSFNAPFNKPSVLITDTSLPIIIVDKSHLIDFIGTHKIKIGFVQLLGKKKVFSFVDFNTSPISIVQCKEDTVVYSPSISPDGKFIAWSSKGEGASGKSSISVRVLREDFLLTSQFSGFIPRWWVDEKSKDTFLIYCDGASLNNKPEWIKEKTYRRRITGGIFNGAEEILWDKGSYHGGLSSDGRFLGTGYPIAKVVDLQLKDTNIFYFQPPWNGRTDTPQICNFSMSPSLSDPGTALFLDFGYSAVSTLVGKPYKFHSVIFVATPRLMSKEHIAKWFEVPQGYDQWNYSEWSNNPDFAIAVSQTAIQNDSDAVTIINCKDSSYCHILKGKNILDVTLWIDPLSLPLVEDEYRYFGKYDIPIYTGGQVWLAKKLRLFWHEREKISCIIIGNSPLLFGFDPSKITVMPALNIAAGQSPFGVGLILTRNYVLPHASSLKAIVMDLDPGTLNINCYSPENLPSILIGLYNSKGYELDSINNFYKDGLPTKIIDKIKTFDSTLWSNLDLNGKIISPLYSAGWGEPIIEGTGFSSLQDTIVARYLNELKTLIKKTSEKNIIFILLNCPQNPRYKETEMIGRFGPKRDVFRELANLLYEWEKEFPNFRFYDANNYGDHDFTDSEAMDANHLNLIGGAKLATRVDSILKIMSK
ncbi:MAG: formylglycine-generating enzyme family protein [Chitinispirillaceae bacterium]|nr:formylglycine-generating enzyme family protein [Chitinispirillaceae bacterium]